MPMFNMIVESGWERARGQTFWTKEPETVAWIKGFTDEGIFWDIGANIGIYSLYCAQKHPDMIIHAFEPHKGNFIRCWQNILLNDFVKVTAYFVALGAAQKMTLFNSQEPTVGSSGGQAEAGNGYPVGMITGDRMAERARACPNYVKIDTDGNEYDVLRGMPETLQSPELKSLLVEINNNKHEILEMMHAAGFAVDTDLMELINRPGYDNNVIFTRI